MFMYVLCRYICVCTKCSKGVFYSLAMHGALICHSQNDIIEVNQNTLETTLTLHDEFEDLQPHMNDGGMSDIQRFTLKPRGL